MADLSDWLAENETRVVPDACAWKPKEDSNIIAKRLVDQWMHRHPIPVPDLNVCTFCTKPPHTGACTGECLEKENDSQPPDPEDFHVDALALLDRVNWLFKALIEVAGDDIEPGVNLEIVKMQADVAEFLSHYTED